MFSIKAKLLYELPQYMGYTIYVFKNLEPFSWENEYVMVLKFPNWQGYLPEEDDEGYLEFKSSTANESTWWDGSEKHTYKYSNFIFYKFVKDCQNLKIKL